MAISHSVVTPTVPKEIIWDKKFILENLPQWIYTDNPEPKSLTEGYAKLSSLQYTISDIELQIEIREYERETGNSRHGDINDFARWKLQALRAKQTHLYLTNAYKYWVIMNEKEELDLINNYNINPDAKLDKVIELLIKDPSDFVDQLQQLL